MRVRLNELDAYYKEISKKYGLDFKDVKLIFVEALICFFRTEDVFLFSEGVLVRGKYLNVKGKDFDKIIDIFNMLCIERTRVKLKHYLTIFFAERGRIVYARIEERSDYHYTVRLMHSKETPLRYVAPIKIERNGERFPENMKMVPVEVFPGKYQMEKNLFRFEVQLFSKKLAGFHLKLLEKKLYERYSISVKLEIALYAASVKLLRIKNRTGIHLNGAIVTYIVNYFSTFGVKVDIRHVRSRKGVKHAAGQQ